MYTPRQRDLRERVLAAADNICFYCGNRANNVEFHGKDGEDSLAVCSPCIQIIEATSFLQEAQPAERVVYLHAMRNDAKVGKEAAWSLRPPGYEPKYPRYQSPTKPKNRLRERLAQRNKGVV